MDLIEVALAGFKYWESINDDSASEQYDTANQLYYTVDNLPPETKTFLKKLIELRA